MWFLVVMFGIVLIWGVFFIIWFIFFGVGSFFLVGVFCWEVVGLVLVIEGFLVGDGDWVLFVKIGMCDWVLVLRGVGLDFTKKIRIFLFLK